MFGLFTIGIIFLFAIGSLVYINSSETDFFFTMAEKFADNHIYVNGTYGDDGVYKCDNYSKDFAIVAKNLGYEVYYYANYDKRHSYNLVAIEPQSGKIKVLEQ